MRYLLDTQVFIWWDSDPARLPAHALAALNNPNRTLVLSMASVWEMQIKVQLGKLNLRTKLETLINDQRLDGLVILNIELEHIYGLSRLPQLHRDPFDRLIIAQAIVDQLALMTSDDKFTLYNIPSLWHI